jgi:hypothetical protein
MDLNKAMDNFGMMKRAGLFGRLAVMSYIEKATGHEVPLVCVANQLPDGGMEFVPVAELISCDPAEKYQPGDPTFVMEPSLGREVVAASIRQGPISVDDEAPLEGFTLSLLPDDEEPSEPSEETAPTRNFKHHEFPVKAGRKVSRKITVEQLMEKYKEAVILHGEYDADDYDDEEDAFTRPPHFISTLTPAIEKDLGKVDFDTENVMMGSDLNVKSQVLPNGLAVIPVQCGGDWEFPVAFVIYWDGTELRAYMPPNGNFWNRMTCKAYGNAHEDWKHPEKESEDDLDCKKWYGMPYQGKASERIVGVTDVGELDWDLMFADVQKRIEVVDED